jgi:hypothetical protein
VFKHAVKSVAFSLLLLPLIFLLGACQLEEASSHVTYTYSITSLPKDRMTNPDDHAYIYRSGEQVSLLWTPHQGNETQDTKPKPVRIDAGLVGPFATIDALKAAMSFDNNNVISGRIATVAPPVQTNNWTNKAVSTNLQLPTAPGYYMLVQRILVNNQGSPYPVPTGQIISILK